MELEDVFAPVLNEGHVPAELFEGCHAAPARDLAGNSWINRSSGIRPCCPDRGPESCLTQTGTSASLHWPTMDSSHAISIGLWPGPLSPPRSEERRVGEEFRKW